MLWNEDTGLIPPGPPRRSTTKGAGALTKEAIKQAVADAIEQHKDEIIRLGEDIFRHPELGLSYECGIAITGSKAVLTGRAAMTMTGGDDR